MEEEEEQQNSVMIPGLPDEVSMLCLARLSFGLYPLLSCVSRSWWRALTLSALFDLRNRLGREEHLVLVCGFGSALAKPGLLSFKCRQFCLIDPRLSKCYPLPLPPPPLLRAYPTGSRVDVLALGRQVYILRVLRGESRDCPDALCYDFVSRHWCTAPPPMLQSRSGFASAAVDGYVYAAGGVSGGLFFLSLKNAERFDLASKKWEKIADMTETRYNATGIARNGSFCVIGGSQFTSEGKHILNDSAEIWDALKEKWQLIPGILPNDMSKVAMVKGKLYGLKYRPINELMLFDEKRKQWNPVGGLIEDGQQENVEYHKLIGVGDELWMLREDINGKCTLIAADPESLPLCWRLLPFSFDKCPSDVCVVTL